MFGRRSRSGRGLGEIGPGAARRRLLVATVAGVALIVVLTVFAFGRNALFPQGTETRAIFSTGSQLKKGSVVRRAGLDIGQVLEVQASTDGRALVTMRIKPDVEPVRTDSRLSIRPRLAFEGNFYIDVVGGTRSAPPVAENTTFPLTQTSVPVQLDQVLTSFDRPVRDSSKRLVTSLSTGLGAGAGNGPESTFGAEGLRQATRALGAALPSIGRVSRAARGTQIGDLGEALDSTSDLTGTLARNPRELAAIVANYDTVIGRLAASDGDVAASLRSASATLRTAPASLTKLDRMLPELTTFAQNLRPSLRELPDTTAPADRAFAQLQALARKPELPSVVSALDDPIRRLPGLSKQLQFALPMLEPIGRCVSQNIVPVLNKRVPDGKLSVDQPAWLEFLHAAANLTGGSPGFDGNGATFRAGLGAGTNVAVGTIPGLGKIVGGFDPSELEGVRPVWLGYDVLPAKRPDVRCDTQPVAKLESKVGVPFGGRLKSMPAPMAQLDEEGKAAATEKLLAPLTKAIQGKLKPGTKTAEGPSGTSTTGSGTPAPSAPTGAGPSTPSGPATTSAAPATPKDEPEGLIGGLAKTLGDIVNPGGSR